MVTFVSAYLYQKFYDGPGKLLPTQMWAIVFSLTIAFYVLFSTFLMKIDRRYVRTFFSLMTSKTFACLCFTTASNDQIRIQIFTQHSEYWEAIEGDIREWVARNWIRWNDERPDFFLERFHTIPAHVKPDDEELNKQAKKNKPVLKKEKTKLQLKREKTVKKVVNAGFKSEKSVHELDLHAPATQRQRRQVNEEGSSN